MKPKNSMELKDLAAKTEERRRSWLVGLVGPTGDVTECYLGPDKDAGNGHSRGIQPAHFAEGEVRLTQYGRENGWTMLEARCKEDGCPGVYAAWVATVHARMDGHPIQLPMAEGGGFDMSAIYPPSVIKQRALGGTSSGSRRAFIPGKGLVEATEVDPEDAKARLLELRDVLGEGSTDAHA